MDVGRVMGVGRWGLIGGTLVVGAGSLGSVPTVTWAGVAIAVVALGVNVAGKFALYARLSIPPAQRGAVMAAWSLVAGSVAGLLIDYAYSTTSPGYEGYFWSLAVGAAGFAAVYQGLRSKFVPDEAG